MKCDLSADLDDVMKDALCGEPERRLLIQLWAGIIALEERGYKAPDLEEHYHSTIAKIHRRKMGSAARLPKEVERYGVISASVEFLKRNNWTEQKAREFVASCAGIDRTELRKILNEVKNAPNLQGAYRLCLKGASEHYLNIMTQKTSITRETVFPTPERVVEFMFSEASD